MIKANKYLTKLTESSSFSFIVLGDDNKKWVVRAKKKQKFSTRLFNEFTAGILASEIGFNKPKVELIKLTSEIISNAEKNHPESDNFEIDSDIAVGTEYIENLERIVPEDNSSIKNSISYKNQLIRKFGVDYNFNPFYAYCVFAEWIFLRDKKYENLHVMTDLRPIFLDFDVSFTGLSYEHQAPDKYSLTEMISDNIFSEVIIWEKERFEVWLSNIQSCNKDKIKRLLTELPQSWELPNGIRQKIIRTLLDNREQFIKEFMNFIKYKKNEI